MGNSEHFDVIVLGAGAAGMAAAALKKPIKNIDFSGTMFTAVSYTHLTLPTSDLV